jgi:hypothetical protein
MGALLIGLLAGCNTDARRPASPAALPDGATGSVQLTIAWPARARFLPRAANSVVISLTDSLGRVNVKTVARPEASTLSDVRFPSLAAGTLTAACTAYASTDGSGEALAAGTQRGSIAIGRVTTLTITLASLATQLTVPDTVYLGIGQVLTPEVSALTAAGLAMPVDRRDVQWTVSEGDGLLTVAADGRFTGVAAGVVRLTATYAGLTSAPVTVYVYDAATMAPSVWSCYAKSASSTAVHSAW